MIKQDQHPLRRTVHHPRSQWTALTVALIIPFVAAAIGGVATSRSLFGWYRRLRKPTWNPPDWLFAPVWNLLFTAMGVASWLVWRRGQLRGEEETSEDQHAIHAEVQGALLLYGIQLVLNTLWSVIFFGLRRVDLALIEIVPFWTTILVTGVRFYRIHPVAGWLLVPYQLWVTFAALLNARIWQLNRSSRRRTLSEWLYRAGW